MIKTHKKVKAVLELDEKTKEFSVIGIKMLFISKYLSEIIGVWNTDTAHVSNNNIELVIAITSFMMTESGNWSIGWVIL